MCNITQEYINYYKEFRSKYGEKVVILMQIGSFYEMQMTHEHGNVDIIAKILNIQVTKKNKSIPDVTLSNPIMAGFPMPALNKYLPVLLDLNYTVVIINQKDDFGKIKRVVSGVYSNTIRPIDDNKISQNMAIVYIDKMIISKAIYNNSLNELTLVEIYNDNKKDRVEYICSELSKCASNEIVIYTDDNIEDVLKRVPENINVILNKNDDMKNNCKNDYIRNVYKNVSFGLIAPIEYFNLDRYVNVSNCLVKCLEYIENHLPLYLNNIQIPIMVNDDNYLRLELDTVEQLYLEKGLFKVIDNTITSIGSRHLKKSLTHPYNNPDEIKRCFDLTEYISLYKDDIKKHLLEIYDIQRILRKMSISAMTSNDICNLYTSLTNVSGILEISNEFKEYAKCNIESDDIDSILNNISSNVKIDMASNCHGSSFAFILIDEEIDNMLKLYDNKKNCINEHREYLNDILIKQYKKNGEYVKVNGDGEFVCTKIRGTALRMCLDKTKYEFKTLTNEMRIINNDLKNVSNELKDMLNEIAKVHNEKFEKYQSILYKQNIKLFENIISFIAEIDKSYSNSISSVKNKYTRPIIKTGDIHSSINAVGLRHPIIEKINNDTMYIPNDIRLDDDASGIVLYAINSSGKSSLLKSIGISVVMAQAGLYVAAENFVLSPFNKIICQLDVGDNIWKSQSSFVREMTGLKFMLENADHNTLCLADELTSSTEQVSATALFASTILTLDNINAKYMFTTHLHTVAEIDKIKTNKRIQIKHLNVSVVDNNIVFTRKLQDGPCNPLYGLEIANAVGLPKEFIKMAFDIRNNKGDFKSVKAKKSRYNSKKELSACEICGYTQTCKKQAPLHAHHIEYQETADENDFTKHFHKNRKFNLVSLCNECHESVHNNKLQINGYIQTSDGVKLDYSWY